MGSGGSVPVLCSRFLCVACCVPTVLCATNCRRTCSNLIPSVDATFSIILYTCFCCLPFITLPVHSPITTIHLYYTNIFYHSCLFIVLTCIIFIYIFCSIVLLCLLFLGALLVPCSLCTQAAYSCVHCIHTPIPTTVSVQTCPFPIGMAWHVLLACLWPFPY